MESQFSKADPDVMSIHMRFYICQTGQPTLVFNYESKNYFHTSCPKWFKGKYC